MFFSYCSLIVSSNDWSQSLIIINFQEREISNLFFFSFSCYFLGYCRFDSLRSQNECFRNKSKKKLQIESCKSLFIFASFQFHSFVSSLPLSLTLSPSTSLSLIVEETGRNQNIASFNLRAFH